MAEMFVVLVFAKCHQKYVHWNKPIFFSFESPLYALWEKYDITKTTDYDFGQTFLLPLSLTHIRTLSMDTSLKMSTILFVLRYLRYKGCVKSRIWDSKVDPIVTSSPPLISSSNVGLNHQEHLNCTDMSLLKCIIQ